MKRHVSDTFVKKAVEMDLRSRSAFKLQEINKQYHILKRNDKVIDLGAAPGGWSVVVSGIIDPAAGGQLVSVDLLDMEPVKNGIFHRGDFTKVSTQADITTASGHVAFSVVLSDMMTNTCGNHFTDHCRSLNLCYSVLDFCSLHLKPGGSLLCKYFRGEDDKELLARAKLLFKDVKTVKPKSSRGESTEAFLLARNKVNNTPPPPTT